LNPPFTSLPSIVSRFQLKAINKAIFNNLVKNLKELKKSTKSLYDFADCDIQYYLILKL